jgi:hypothetical protein
MVLRVRLARLGARIRIRARRIHRCRNLNVHFTGRRHVATPRDRRFGIVEPSGHGDADCREERVA